MTKFFIDAIFAIFDALLIVATVWVMNYFFNMTSNIPYIEIFGWTWWGAFVAKAGWIYPKHD